MDEPEIEILEYLTSSEKNPFRDWLKNIRDRQTRMKIRVRLNRVRLGNLGDYKSVGGGVNELRVKHGPGYRVYFGRKGNKIIILLCGGDKKSQSRDIALAKAYWNDYLRRIK